MTEDIDAKIYFMRIYTHDFVYLGVSTIYSTVGRNFWPHYCIAIISGCCKRKVNVLVWRGVVLQLSNLFGLDSLSPALRYCVTMAPFL